MKYLWVDYQNIGSTLCQLISRYTAEAPWEVYKTPMKALRLIKNTQLWIHSPLKCKKLLHDDAKIKTHPTASLD